MIELQISKCQCTDTNSWTGLVKPVWNQKSITTCDDLSELLVLLAQDADETRQATGVYERHLVVRVLVDEVARGTSGITLHFLVVAGEELNQSWNAV